MPAKSVAQRQMMAIAEHEPSKLYKRNRAVLKMSKSQLSEFASTKGLKRKKVKKADVESYSYNFRKRKHG